MCKKSSETLWTAHRPSCTVAPVSNGKTSFKLKSRRGEKDVHLVSILYEDVDIISVVCDEWNSATTLSLSLSLSIG